MYIAQLKNKISWDDERSEDLLTSNVLGIWRYIPGYQGLLSAINRAQDLGGGSIGIPLDSEVTSMEFWPWLMLADGRGIEPDVVITVRTPTGEDWTVIIEAKFLSGKSSLPTESGLVEDQLGKQLMALRHHTRNSDHMNLAVVFLTANANLPRDSMTASLKELGKKSEESAGDGLFWMNWVSVTQSLRELNDSFGCESGYSVFLSDALAILDRHDFTPFEGISIPSRLSSSIRWTFESHSDRYDWAIGNEIPSWNFT